jgi:small subunit ribosomal protein S1
MMSEVPIKDEMSMEELLREADAAQSKTGAVVTAYVVDVLPNGVLVDVGLKEEGFIPLSEFQSLPKPPAKGESFPAVIKRMSGPEGRPLVSMKDAKDRVHRVHVAEALKSGAPLEGTVLRQVKGGLIVDVGMEGFLPASQADRRPVKDLKPLVGQKIQVVVIEMDEKKGNLVLSRRKLMEKDAAQKQEATLKELTPGKLFTGTVTGLTDFGAFVDIGGIEGLIRLSDISWRRLEKPSEELKVGQSVEVKVLRYDAATKKIALGRKQLMPHPWEGVEKRYPVNAPAKGKVTSLASFGAFVQLEPGVEGLVHQSEFSWKERWAKPEEFVKVGQEVEVVVLGVQRNPEKISLSLKRVNENPWRDAASLYKPGAKVKGVVTHMTDFGAFLKLPVGVEGLLRTTDLSWTKPVKHPKEKLAEGQELEVVVLEVDASQERISLGFKQLSQDPYSKYKTGAVVDGKVLRLNESFAILELEPDVEATVHVSEIPSETRLTRPSEALSEGQEVTGIVLKADRKTRRIEISIRKHERQQERQLLKKYQGKGDTITLGDVVSDWDASSGDDTPKS